MSWIITGAEKTPVDKLGIQNVSLLLHGNADGSGNILDSSPSPKTISKFGDAASATPPSYPNSNSAFGNAIAFDGTDDRLTVPANTDFAFGTGAFTCECWVRTTAFENRGILNITPNTYFQSTITNTIGIGFNLSKTWSIYAKDTVATSTVEYSTNTWYHVALVRSGTTTVLYVDGSAIITVTNDTTNYTCAFLGIGGWYSLVYLLKGFIDDLRITKGVARYTSNFTSPTAPFPDI